MPGFKKQKNIAAVVNACIGNGVLGNSISSANCKYLVREEAISINYFNAFCFALFGSSMVFQSAISTIANGTGKIHVQALCYAGGILVKLIVVHLGIAITGNWVVIILANALILIPYCIIQNHVINCNTKRAI